MPLGVKIWFSVGVISIFIGGVLSHIVYDALKPRVSRWWREQGRKRYYQDMSKDAVAIADMFVRRKAGQP